jgi:peptidoglycan/LPS O-acetylase OafA/YrhL
MVPEARSGRRTAYVPAYDGVRALAVLAVLAFHGGVVWAGGGFLGVDAFLVLSGFLITSLLLQERQRTGTVALAAFWGRRARRLLPALFVMVTAVALSARAFLPPEELRLLRGDGLAALFYVANWRMILRGGDYFAQTSAPSPLQHTWSLGIEEQFYLLWPLLLLLVVGRGRRWLLLLCGAGVVVSTVALASRYSLADPGRAYYGTDTRAASLLVGAGLATLLAGDLVRRGPGRRRPLLATLALLGGVATAWLWTHAAGDDAALYRGGLLAAALAVAAVLAHVALVPDGMSARLLSVPPLPALGRISYGVYLWHWPLFLAVDAGRTGLRGTPLFLLRCTVTLLVAVASYVLVERPIRSGRMLWRRPLHVSGIAAATAVTVAAVVTAAGSGEGGSGPVAAAARSVSDGIDRLPAASAVPAGRTSRPDPAVAHRRRPGEPVVVDVFGDSVAWSLVSYLPRTRGLDARDRTMLGCGVARTAPYRYYGQTYPTVARKCRAWPRLWRRAVAADDPDVAFILVGRWETMDRVLHGRWTHVGEPGLDAYLRAQLERAVALAGRRGARVVLATEPFNRRGERPDGGLWPEDEPSRVVAWNRLLRGVAARHPEVQVVDLGRRVSPQGRFSWDAGGVQVRADGLHLTPAGVRTWVAPWLLPRLRAAAGETP